jgi:hypothetical protein
LRLVLVCWANRPLTALTSTCCACEVKTCRKRLFKVGPGALHIMPAGLKCPVCKRVPKPRALFCSHCNFPRDPHQSRKEGLMHGFCRVCRVIPVAAHKKCMASLRGEVQDWACIQRREHEANLKLAAQSTARCASSRGQLGCR